MAKKLTDKQKGEILGNAVSGLTGGIALGVSNAQTADLSAKEAELQNLSGTQFDTGSYDALEEQLSNNIFAKTNYTTKDLQNRSFKELGLNTVLGTAGGLISGLSKGSILGGIIEGGAALLGGTTGMISNYFKTQNDVADLNNAGVKTNNIVNNNIVNSASSIDNKMFNSSLLNLSAYGGPLFNHGGDWSNGLTFINEGGTHEQNPFGGVPVGVDQEGTPNLVEEGEIIWNDYVFSNRLKPTKKQLETVGFNPKYEGMTFAEVVEKVQQESAENPLDKISTDTLNENLMYLMTMQEEIRMKKEVKKNNKFPRGGFIEVVEEPVEEDNSDIEAFWGAAKTPEQRLAIMELDPTNAYQKSKQSDKLPWQSALRYASPLMHGITLLNNLKKPDYSNADNIERAARAIPGGSYTPLGNTLDLDLVDRNVYTNPILANAASTRRAIMQNSSNAGSANAALLANNSITNNALGLADIQGTQANNEIKSKIAQFDLTRDQANSQMGLQALAMDQQRAQNILNATAQAGQLRSQLDAARSQAISSSLTGIADDLGGIGRESSDRYLMEKLIGSGALQWTKAKNGGMLTRKRRRK